MSKGRCTDEEIATLCDIAMCGDHGIGECYGAILELPKCIAKGDDICALRYKKPSALVLICVSFVFILGMGYLSSKDFTLSYMNWATEFVNIIGQGTFLLSALSLKKAVYKNHN